MPHATLINTTDLNSWANRRESQSKLPHLLRRLIRATTPNLQKLNFPADESVQLGGWDGIVAVEVGNDLVPNGISGWELGTNQAVKGKADDDYEKRTANPNGVDLTTTTFIFPAYPVVSASFAPIFHTHVVSVSSASADTSIGDPFNGDP